MKIENGCIYKHGYSEPQSYVIRDGIGYMFYDSPYRFIKESDLRKVAAPASYIRKMRTLPDYINKFYNFETE